MAACFVTSDHCKSWDKTGKQEFLKLCRSVADKVGSSCLGNRDFRQAVYEVCLHAVKGNLRQEHALSAVTDLNDKYQDVISLVTDVLTLIDIELSTTDDDRGQRERYTSFIGAFSQLTASETVFKSRLDLDSLENSGILPSKTLFQQKYVKIRTRLYYKQQKFNLLREESEGYSKLITELNQDVSDHKLTPEQVLQNIKSLIGCFNLDPNRVIDVLLESFENHPDQETFYVPLVRAYVRDKETLCHVLGFKFQFCKEEETPASLYKLAALLLKNDLIELDGLCPHLSPSDQSVIDYSKKELSDAKAYARKLMVVNLSDKASEDKKAAEDQVKIDPHTNNQKLGLVEALLSIGAWEKSKSILDRLPEFYGTTYKPVATSLCALIHTVLDPVYRKYSGMSSRIAKTKNKHEMPGCNIQKASTFKEVYSLAFPMVTYLGPYAACDPILVVKLIRLGKTYMSKKNQGTISMDDNIFYYGLLSILDEVVIPSLSFQSCNCCVSEELWQLLKLFPYELRYRMYGNWKNEMYSQHPRLMRLRADCLERAKYIMKRLSKENVKPSGRQLGKLSHSNPSVLFEYVLSQIQKYDNLIGPVVDSLKYLTSLSYDVLIFCIIEAIANPEKEKTKYDDTTLSLWLQSLATFAGSICKKYPVDLAGLMQYVTNQLKAGKSIDLILLREMVQKMAGIEISEEITNDQLDAMSGGELLKQEGGYFSQVRNTKKSSTRLKDTVLEHDLALSLCLLISQQRDAVIYKEGIAQHLKLIGKLYDQCQDTLVQFGSFLSLQLSTEEFVKRLPPIDVMVDQYHVRPNSAFFLSRPLYSYELNAKYEELRKAEKAEKDKEKDKDRSKSSTAMRTQKYIEATEIVMNPVIECVKPLQSPKIWEDLSPNFYVTFWSLSVYDISVPTGSYQKQIRHLENIISAIDDTKETSKKKKEKDRCNQLIEKLRDEEKKQSDHVQRVIARLKNDKEKWFVAKTTKNESITQFLQLCIFPRCCFTASDAIFCAKFLHILHNLKTSSFSTLICYDRIFCDITYTVSSCTENEAHRYGRFLCAALETVMRWHSAKHIYEKDCANYPGFVTVFRKGEVGNNIADQLDFENYRHVCHKWHFRITKAMVSCIESGNYIQIRNALIILTKVLPQYPRIIQFGQALERRIDRLRSEEKDKRHDIYALAMGYGGMLKSKKSHWVPEAEFHLKDKDGKAKVTPHGMGSKSDAATGSRDSKTTSAKSASAEKAASAAKEKEKDGLKLRIKTPSAEPKEQKGEERQRIKVIGEVKRSSEEKVKMKVVTPSESKKSDSADKKETASSSKPSSRDKERKEKGEKAGESSVEASKSREKVREDKVVKEERSVRREEKEKSRESLGKGKDEKASTSRDIKDDRILKERKDEKSRELKAKDDSHHETKTKEDKIRMHREGKQAEKREKDEKHERIKLKRSYSPEREDSEGRRERDHYREEREEGWAEGRAGSATSNSSSHRSYHQDESPIIVEERDSKRRKTDPTPSSSKDDGAAPSKSRHRRSLSPDKERERERKDKKRVKREAKENSLDNDYLARGDQEDHHEVNDTSSSKKRKEVVSSSRSASKLNGESVEREVKKESHHDNGYPKASSSRNDVIEHTPEDGHSRSKTSKDSEKKRSSSKRPKPS